MLLKTLSLAGFKSFADRTRLSFDAGVNVIVGPNGTGKSNLLDALAWVMGTQATRTLRTERMDDVIFAGTATRPALGRAEVSLTVDNSDGFLPIDLAEIKMTRRLLRDGTSEYELNGASCRLLDIQELLSDGGVGRHQHVLVGQGQIGEILNARPDEHRMVIEEAAGITKHRSRRDRALRRLDQTDVDVDRLRDILDQERRRLRPLKRQANAAERYDSVKQAAVDLRLWLGGEQLRRIRGRLGEASVEHSSVDAAQTGASAELETLTGTLAALRSAAGEVGQALERDTSAAARLETLRERFQRLAMVSRERRLSLEDRLQGAGERRRDLDEERAELLDRLHDIDDEEAAAVVLADERQTTLHALDDEERALAAQLQLPAEGLAANLRGDLHALETAAARDTREEDQLLARRGVLTDRIGTEARSGEDLVEQIQLTDEGVAGSQGDYRDVRSQRGEAQAAWETAEDDHREAAIRLAEATARHDAIEVSLSGVGDSMARDRALDSAGVVGPIARALDPPAEYAVALDAALGEWATALLLAGHDDLEAVTRQLKAEGLGSVTLVSPGAPADTSPSREVRDIAAQWGVELLVDRLGADADRPLAEAILGDVVVVEGWSTGWDLVHRHPELRAVTPEGDVVDIRSVRLASPDGAGPAALEASSMAIEAAELEIARTESRRGTSRREFERVRSVERTALEALEHLEARLAGQTEALALNERAQGETRAEMSRLDARRTALATAAQNRAERISELRARVDDLDSEAEAHHETWEALTERRNDVAHQRDEARRLREESTAALAGVGERRKLMTQRLETAGRELNDLDAVPVDPVSIERLAAVERHSRRADHVLTEHVTTLRERQRRLRSDAGDAGRDLDGAQRRKIELETTVAECREHLATLGIELAELRVRDESVLEVLRRDADASEETALAASEPELDDDANPEDTLRDVEARLRRMGPINPLAAAEYAELAARVEELESQLTDLDESRVELRKVISALDDEMATMFMQAFDDIAALYEENFDLVFPGGRGTLRLGDPAKPLETGVELEAQPLGKKVGRLSLLSGGERSLAALAFLFAVFRARPSPFYVLDEVEAALDDANLRRFLRLVATLRGTAQLVIITHQQQTMEAADILYGVTMEPGESSLVLAKRLNPVSV